MRRHQQAPLLSIALLLTAGGAAAQEQKIVPTPDIEGGRFGAAIAGVSGSSLVGAPDTDGHGSAYLMANTGNGVTIEVELTVPAGYGGLEPGDRFGESVCATGIFLVVGAPGDDDGGTDAGAVYVFNEVFGNWTIFGKIVASDAEAGDEFGTSVDIDPLGRELVVGAMLDNHPGAANAGSAYYFERSGNDWLERTKLVASDFGTGDRLGCAVSLDGDTIAVGAFSRDEVVGVNAGAVYVFRGAGTAWPEEAKLTPTDSHERQQFGWDLELRGDELAIGARKDDEAAGQAGAGYVFERTGMAWSQHTKLLATDAAADDWMGHSVAFFGDEIVLGAPRKDGSAGADVGAIYVFERISGAWSQDVRYFESPQVAGNGFGSEVTLAREDYLWVGSPGNDEAGTDAGTVWTYDEHYVSHNWLRDLHLTAADEVDGDQFGVSVAMDGNLAIVGASGDDRGGSVYVLEESGGSYGVVTKLWTPTTAVNTSFSRAIDVNNRRIVIGEPSYQDTAGNQGAVHVFEEVGGAWTLVATVVASPSASESFGNSVSLDGDTLLIGATYGLGATTYAGAAYVFHFDGTNWIQQDRFFASTGAQDDSFGRAVALDGDLAAIGCPGRDGPAGDATGAVFVFRWDGNDWVQETELVHADVQAFDLLGQTVALSGDTILAGAARADNGGVDVGAAYVFRESGSAWNQEAKLGPQFAFADGLFGSAVALDGDIAVIGHEERSPGGYADVFQRFGDLWVRRELHDPSDGSFGDDYGAAVALSGNRMAVGAPRHDADLWNSDMGAIYFEDMDLAVGTNYCWPGVANSSGEAAILMAEGSDVAANDNLTLIAINLPVGEFGIFVASTTPDYVPGAAGASNGNLCVGGSIGRINIIRQADPSGTFSLAVDLDAIPQGIGAVAVNAGETWHFQAWFRDQVGAGSNFTDGLRVLFR